MIKFSFENDVLRMENDFTEREIFFENSVPARCRMKNKKTGFVWQGSDAPVLRLPGIDLAGSRIETFGYSLIFHTKKHDVKWMFRLSDSHRFFETQIAVKGEPIKQQTVKSDAASGVETVGTDDGAEYIEALGTTSHAVELLATEYFDNTDRSNVVLIDTSVPLYHLWADRKYNGHIFVLTDKMHNEECVIIKNSPCAAAHINKRQEDFYAEPLENMHICGSGIDYEKINRDEYTVGYSVATALCMPGEHTDIIKFYYNEFLEETTPYIMSNTWGGGHKDACVCEEFILKEIDAAAELGIDIVQIDDGWQKGKSANSTFHAENKPWGEGYRSVNPDFWEVDEEKFPSGLKFLCDYAWERKIELGLWFSPDGKNNYEAWKADADVIYSMFSKYGIRYFKLDGISVTSKTAEKNITDMLEDLTSRSFSRIKFNMDITAGKRFGYFVNKHIGQLFVENRYTGKGTYYPHATLRNLWLLSKYIPSKRFQFEVPDNSINADCYAQDDFLAPANYDADYIFASVMVSHPLMWMELSGLSGEPKVRLKKIISAYKKYRNDFGTVIPIFDKPDGFSCTGFFIEGYSRNYALLFREHTDKCDFDISIKEIIATNDPSAAPGKAKINKKFGYIFAVV